MGSLFSSPKTPPIQPTPPPVEAIDPAVQDARRRAIIAEGNARGRASTLVTGGAGDTSTAPTSRATLLGR